MQGEQFASHTLYQGSQLHHGTITPVGTWQSRPPQSPVRFKPLSVTEDGMPCHIYGSGISLMGTHPHPDSRVQLQRDKADPRQFSGMMLSAGIVFFLGMAMNATTIQGIQGNILELARVGTDIQKLTAYSSALARSVEDRPGDRKIVLSENPELPTRHTTPAKQQPDAPLQEAPLQSGPDVVNDTPSALLQSKPSPQARTSGTPLDYGKWGPPLLLNTTRVTSHLGKHGDVPHGKEVRSNLLALGFDVREDHTKEPTNARIQQALNEYSLLYLPARKRQKTTKSDQLIASIKKYAAQARKDATKFSIDSGVLAAIRLGSIRTGVEFSFLMELAATESSFDPTSIAPITAAAGLYQFKDDTWLEAVKTYGKKYGMDSYASQVENYVDDSGKKRLRIPDPVVHEYVLALRHNPRISALLAGEYIKYNRQRLSHTLEREPDHTELYLSHFFGATGAISFLKNLYENPDRIAGEVFPTAAKNNRAIFRPKRSKPRTVAEIYQMFERKFNAMRYADANPS